MDRFRQVAQRCHDQLLSSDQRADRPTADAVVSALCDLALGGPGHTVGTYRAHYKELLKESPLGMVPTDTGEQGT